MAHRDGVFHLFFSVFDQERSSVAHVTTRDFLNFSDFRFRIDGRENGWIGMCSPDITYVHGTYILVFNSWGGGNEIYNRLFYSVSEDLYTWSEYRPLGHELDPAGRIIDGALAHHEGQWVCACKWWQKPRFAGARAIDGPWKWIQDEPATLLTHNGDGNGLLHENFQFVKLGGVWHLLCTDFKPHRAWLYRISDDPANRLSWTHWVDGYQLDIPLERFNTRVVDNAASLLDMTAVDGFYYLIYAGQDEQRGDEFRGEAAYSTPWARGWNKLGLARSRDLVHWKAAGT